MSRQDDDRPFGKPLAIQRLCFESAGCCVATSKMTSEAVRRITTRHTRRQAFESDRSRDMIAA